jgi:RecA/RadA recombinase
LEAALDRLGSRMIVELFGPPGVGKTTVAHMLSARLRKRGNCIGLVLSYRPSEAPLAGRAEGLAGMRRLAVSAASSGRLSRHLRQQVITPIPARPTQ